MYLFQTFADNTRQWLLQIFVLLAGCRHHGLTMVITWDLCVACRLLMLCFEYGDYLRSLCCLQVVDTVVWLWWLHEIFVLLVGCWHCGLTVVITWDLCVACRLLLVGCWHCGLTMVITWDLCVACRLLMLWFDYGDNLRSLCCLQVVYAVVWLWWLLEIFVLLAGCWRCGLTMASGLTCMRPCQKASRVYTLTTGCR